MRHFWKIGFLLSMLWALVMTYQYVSLRGNPLILKVSEDSANSEKSAESSRKLEAYSFLRQFTQRYINFDSESFLQNQISLSSLMTPELQEKRLKEIDHLKGKIDKNQTRQVGTIKAVSNDRGVYYIRMDLQIFEMQRKNSLQGTLAVQVRSTQRSLENPWGLLVADLKFVEIENERPMGFSGQINLKKNEFSLLRFPCSVESYESLNDPSIHVKITTMDVSEVQIALSQELTAPKKFKIRCQSQLFELQLQQKENAWDLYQEVPAHFAQSRKAKNPYGKTMENELGFVVED